VKDPYAFYAVSNIGSLGALLAYPTLIEPNLSVPASAAAWTWGFRIVALLIVGLSLTVWMARPGHAIESEAGESDAPRPGWWRTLAWMFLSAVGSGFLVSFTSRITQDIAPIPMLWIIPLSLYLITFIVCFGGMYRRDWILPLALIAFALNTFITLRYGWSDLGFDRKVLGYAISISGVNIGLALGSAAFFLLVMLLHGELYALRPAARYLSRYYLVISAGGAIGGAFVSLAAPFLFKVQFEVSAPACPRPGRAVHRHTRARRAPVAELLAEPRRHDRDHRDWPRVHLWENGGAAGVCRRRHSDRVLQKHLRPMRVETSSIGSRSCMEQRRTARS
jgi:hypothetical protein